MQVLFHLHRHVVPIRQHKRLNQSIHARLPSETSRLALLLLCMKLDHIPANASVLYRTAINYLNAIEQVSPVSMHVFQSLVLISLYEISHGIFPVAYLTIGRAARLGILMGVHDREATTQLFQTPKT